MHHDQLGLPYREIVEFRVPETLLAGPQASLHGFERIDDGYSLRHGPAFTI